MQCPRKASGNTAMAARSSAQATDSHVSSSGKVQRPPYSYIALITMAIESSPRKRALLSEIVQFVRDTFPYYHDKKERLGNCIKHNLSRHECFVKLPLQAGRVGKSCYWTIDPAYRNMFHGGSYRRRKFPSPKDAVTSGTGTLPTKRTSTSTITARRSSSTIFTSASQSSIVSTVPSRNKGGTATCPVEVPSMTTPCTIAHLPTSIALALSSSNKDGADSGVPKASTVTRQLTLPSTATLHSNDVAYSSLQTLLETGTLASIFTAKSGEPPRSPTQQPVYTLSAPSHDGSSQNPHSQPRVLLIPLPSSGTHVNTPVLASAVSLVPIHEIPTSKFLELQQPQSAWFSNGASVSSTNTPTATNSVRTTAGGTTRRKGTTTTSVSKAVVHSRATSTPSGTSASFTSNSDNRTLPASKSSSLNRKSTFTTHSKQTPKQSTSTTRTQATAGNSSQSNSKHRKTVKLTSALSQRPPYSYAALISLAIESMPLKRATFNDICNFIQNCFPYYREKEKWKGYIRHTLSVNKCFVRLLQGREMPGPNSHWIIDPPYRNMFVGGSYRRRNLSVQRLPMYSNRAKKKEDTHLATKHALEERIRPLSQTSSSKPPAHSGRSPTLIAGQFIHASPFPLIHHPELATMQSTFERNPLQSQRAH